MKGFTKRFLSFVLCGILLFSCAYPAVAAKEVIENDLPIVHVLGRLKAIYNTNGKQLYPFKKELTDIVMADSDALVSSVATSLFTGNWKYLGNTISKNLKPSFGELVLDGNGEIYNGTYTLPYTEPRPIESNYQMNDYLFNYDWRLDPITLAGDLNDFIDAVLAATGKEKVHLVSRCLGTSIAASYLTFYGADKIDTCVMYAGSAMGILPISTFFSGSLDIDPDALQRFAANADEEESDYVELMKTFASILKASNLAKNVFENNFKTAINQILPDLLLETYATMPSHWSMVSHEYYEKAKAFVFSGKEEEYAGLISKIDNYHYGVQQILPETLTRLKDEGLKVCIFAKYNFELAPLYENSNFQSDDTIEISSMSFGAYAPVFGKVLSDEYVANAKANGTGKYISPDYIVDASTCLFPDSTWFIKDAGHENWPASVYDFILQILRTKNQYTVTTDPKYPQFLQYNALNGSLSKVTRYSTLQVQQLVSNKLEYNGEVQKPKAKLIDAAGKTLKEGTDYTISYSRGCKEIGRYYANINFKNNYSLAPMTLYFDICPANIRPAIENGENSSVVLAWDAVEKADGYIVYKYNDSKKIYEKIAETTDTYYFAENLSGATAYNFAVKAYANKDGKVYLSPAYLSAKITTKLSAPSIKAASSSESAAISWKAVKGAEGYEVYMAQEGGDFIRIATTKNNYYNALNLNLYEAYSFKVRSYAKVNGKTVYSSYSSVKDVIPTESPAAPTISLSSSARTVEISWNKIPGATGYTVYMSTSKNGKYEKVGTTKKTSFLKKSLKASKKYYFKVYAYTKIDDSTFKSDFSAVKSVKAKNTPNAPEIKVTALSKGAKVSFEKVNGAKGYTVYMATSKNGKYTKIGSTTKTYLKKTGLKKNKNYYFKVKAYSKSGGNTYYSSYSSVKSVKTK